MFGLAAGPARAAAAPSPYPDVPDNHWAAESVKQLARRGILIAAAPPKTNAGSKPAQPTYSGNKPVTRYELAVTLYRFVQYLERADRQKRGGAATRGAPSAQPMATPAAPEGAEAVRRLVAGGYLPKNTPLAQNGNALVTADQLADALAQVVSHSLEKRTPVTPGSQQAPDDTTAPPPRRG
jgi:hypothetical protein